MIPDQKSKVGRQKSKTGISREALLLASVYGLLTSFSFSAPNAPLVDAVKSGDKAAILALLDAHADVNAPEPDGTTALAWAARLDDLEVADRLLRARANVHTANRYGITPLYLACVNGSPAMIEKLLQAGADANAVWTEGETPLMTALMRLEQAPPSGNDAGTARAWRRRECALRDPALGAPSDSRAA